MKLAISLVILMSLCAVGGFLVGDNNIRRNDKYYVEMVKLDRADRDAYVKLRYTLLRLGHAVWKAKRQKL